MRTLFFVTLFLCSTFLFAQRREARFIHPGLIRNSLTITPATLFEPAVRNIYLHGTLEGYVDSSLSLRGDGFYFLNTLGTNKPFKFNHSFFAGASYHFKTNNHFDPYFGIEPGVSITQLNTPEILTQGNEIFIIHESTTKANPLFSEVIGFNYYAPKWFHIFVEARYVSGRHMSGYSSTQSLNELRFSFGLGWNINVLRTNK